MTLSTFQPRPLLAAVHLSAPCPAMPSRTFHPSFLGPFSPSFCPAHAPQEIDALEQHRALVKERARCESRHVPACSPLTGEEMRPHLKSHPTFLQFFKFSSNLQSNPQGTNPPRPTFISARGCDQTSCHIPSHEVKRIWDISHVFSSRRTVTHPSRSIPLS